jgi:[CysO sulfur-carrier protein]-S-L-cysteine hydrolase
MTGRGIQISPSLLEEVFKHCRSRYPKEACGYLAGSESTVAQVYPMVNVEDSPIGYSMEPKEQLQTEKRMRENKQQLIGIYHSHTSTEAYPSSVDVSLAISSDISYALISLKDQGKPVFRSFRIDGSNILEEPVRIGEG